MISGVMLTVGRLLRIEKTIGDKVTIKLTFYNTFDYFRHEREIGDRQVVGELVFVYWFLEMWGDNRFFKIE